MAKIQCEDKFLSTDEMRDFAEVLQKNHAKFKPRKCKPVISVVNDTFKITLLDPVVEFNKKKVEKPTVIAIMGKYGFKERP